MAPNDLIDHTVSSHTDEPTMTPSGPTVTSAVLHPSPLQTPDEGAWTSVYAAASPKLEGIGGRYLRDEAEAEVLGAARDLELQGHLWAESCRLTGAAWVAVGE